MSMTQKTNNTRSARHQPTGGRQSSRFISPVGGKTENLLHDSVARQLIGKSHRHMKELAQQVLTDVVTGTDAKYLPFFTRLTRDGTQVPTIKWVTPEELRQPRFKVEVSIYVDLFRKANNNTQVKIVTLQHRLAARMIQLLNDRIQQLNEEHQVRNQDRPLASAGAVSAPTVDQDGFALVKQQHRPQRPQRSQQQRPPQRPQQQQRPQLPTNKFAVLAEPVVSVAEPVAPAPPAPKAPTVIEPPAPIGAWGSAGAGLATVMQAPQAPAPEAVDTTPVNTMVPLGELADYPSLTAQSACPTEADMRAELGAYMAATNARRQQEQTEFNDIDADAGDDDWDRDYDGELDEPVTVHEQDNGAWGADNWAPADNWYSGVVA